MNRRFEFELISFPTELGWMGFALKDFVVHQLKFGFDSEPQLLHAFDCHFDVIKTNRQSKKWKSALQRFAEGRKQDLSDIPVKLDDYPAFQGKVLKACRKIGYGKTLTYGQLAGKAGSPNAARAVGTAMKNNRYPLIVPCHRVVGSNGLGGYSASSGLPLKIRLLQMEGARI